MFYLSMCKIVFINGQLTPVSIDHHVKLSLVAVFVQRKFLLFDWFTHVSNNDVIITIETTDVDESLVVAKGYVYVGAPSLFY